MRQRFNDIFCGVVLCLFVNFVFANTVFIHTHHAADGRLITHSHPYLPSSTNHTHSSVSLDSIAAFNLGASSVVASESVTIAKGAVRCLTVKARICESIFETHISGISRRGPPVAA